MSKQILEEIKTVFEQFKRKNDEMEKEVKKYGEATQELKNTVSKLNERLDELETQLNRPAVGNMNQKEQDFSLAKFLRGMIFQKWDGAEVEQKALAAGNNPDGGYLVRPEYAGGVLDLIRDRTVFNRLGVTRYTNIQGAPFRINKLAGGATGYMIAENQDITASQQTFGQLIMTPKKAAAVVPISNDLIRRADDSVEQIVRGDISTVLANLLDLQMLQGDGTGQNILGTLNTSGVNEKSLGDNGGTPTIDDLYDALYEVEKNNGMVTAWVFHPRTKNTLRKIKDGNQNYVLQPPATASEPPTLLGIPYYETTQIPINLTVGTSTDCSYILAGQWSEAVIAEWLGLQLEASREASYWDGTQYISAFSRDQSVIRAIQEVDFILRRPEMFVKVTGVRP